MTKPLVIDAHNHVGGLASWGIGDPDRAHEDLAVDVEVRCQLLDERGVDQAVVIASHDYLRPDGIADNRRVNDAIAAYRDARTDRFPAAVGIVEPLNGERGLEELDRCKHELGLAGISFHTRSQGVPVDGPWVRRYLERMGELGLVPFLHSIGESSSEALWKIDVVAGALPDLPIVVLDVLSTLEQSLQVGHVAARRSNLHFDTALTHGMGFVRMLLDAAGPGRVLYGSDLYSTRTGIHLQLNDCLPDLLAAGLDPEDEAAVVGGNVARLLGLS